MKFLFKWLDKKLRETRDLVSADEPRTISAGRSIDSHGMNFTVYRANGGHIVETRKYDRKRDISDHGLHIITDDKDLGEEIGKIITLENLRS